MDALQPTSCCPSMNTSSQVEAQVSSPTEDALEKLIAAETRLRLQSDSIHIFDDILRRVESAIISTVLSETDQNLTHAAQRLGISRPTLRNKIRTYMPFK